MIGLHNSKIPTEKYKDWQFDMDQASKALKDELTDLFQDICDLCKTLVYTIYSLSVWIMFRIKGLFVKKYEVVD